MQEAIEECYDRLGRFLAPDCASRPILMGSGNRYEPYLGRCSRTGVTGQTIHYQKSDGSIIPTHTKILWLAAYQNRVGKTSYRLSFGCIVLLPDVILSTDEWADRANVRLPGLRVAKTKEILREAIQTERYLVLGLGKNIDRMLGNDLRYSYGTKMEVNGEVKIAGLDIANQTIDFANALRLAELNLDWDNARRYWELRNRATPSEKELDEMHTLRATFGEHSHLMMRMARQVTRQDLRIAKWLAT
jgi:hypothetical protein